MSTWVILIILAIAVIGYLLYTFVQKEAKTINGAANGINSLGNLADQIGNLF